MFYQLLSCVSSLLTIGDRHCAAMGAFLCEVPIFVWVLINDNLVFGIKMGAYIHGCLFSMGAYYPDFT